MERKTDAAFPMNHAMAVGAKDYQISLRISLRSAGFRQGNDVVDFDVAFASGSIGSFEIESAGHAVVTMQANCLRPEFRVALSP